MAQAPDHLHRFSFREAPIRGQWVRLDAVRQAAGERVAYPAGVAALLAEMLATVAMMAESIQFEGTVSLQSRGAGPLTTVLAECRDATLLRGLARWGEEQAPPTGTSLKSLLGDGELAMTLTQPARAQPDKPFAYQGRIAIEDDELATNLERYFANSEQLPTHLRFASTASATTGLLLQRLPAPDTATEIELMQHDALWRTVSDRVRQLAPARLAELEVRSLLAETFPGHPISLYEPREVQFSCSCSRSRSSATLRALPREELLGLLEELGHIYVTCEVCGARYDYEPVDVHLLLDDGSRTVH